MDRKKLAKIAKEKREEIIKDFYERHKDSIKQSAEKGYSGYNVRFDELDDQLKMALRTERERLSEIVKDVDLELVTTELLITKHRIISKVAFLW